MYANFVMSFDSWSWGLLVYIDNNMIEYLCVWNSFIDFEFALGRLLLTSFAVRLIAVFTAVMKELHETKCSHCATPWSPLTLWRECYANPIMGYTSLRMDAVRHRVFPPWGISHLHNGMSREPIHAPSATGTHACSHYLGLELLQDMLKAPRQS